MEYLDVERLSPKGHVQRQAASMSGHSPPPQSSDFWPDVDDYPGISCTLPSICKDIWTSGLASAWSCTRMHSDAPRDWPIRIEAAVYTHAHLRVSVLIWAGRSRTTRGEAGQGRQQGSIGHAGRTRTCRPGGFKLALGGWV